MVGPIIIIMVVVMMLNIRLEMPFVFDTDDDNATEYDGSERNVRKTREE